MRLAMKNYYRILDIPDNADFSEIEKAYKRLKGLVTKNSISIYSLLPSSEKEDFLKEVEEAYEILRTPEKRRLYDMKLKGVSVEPEEETGVYYYSKQLTFEFAKEAFTFLDYTKKKEEVFIDAIDRIRNDYLLESSGPSITIIEGVKEESDNGQVKTPSSENTKPTAAEEIRTQVSTSIEPHNTAILTDPPHAPAEQTIKGEIEKEKESEKEEIEKNPPPVSIPVDTQPADTQPPPTVEPPSSGTQNNTAENKCKENLLIIDENTEFSGSLLRMIREGMGLTIKDIARITKITTTNLNNIEEERYEELPALVYVKGYLTTIAKCLNLRADLVVRSYIKRMNERMERKSR